MEDGSEDGVASGGGRLYHISNRGFDHLPTNDDEALEDQVDDIKSSRSNAAA